MFVMSHLSTSPGFCGIVSMEEGLPPLEKLRSGDELLEDGQGLSLEALNRPNAKLAPRIIFFCYWAAQQAQS